MNTYNLYKDKINKKEIPSELNDKNYFNQRKSL